MAATARPDIAQVVTNAIIAELEAGVLPWTKPWSSDGKAVVPVTLPKRHTGEHYRGINILILWDAAQRGGYRSPYWMTFKQALAYKAGVRKGEKGTAIVYVDRIVKTEEGAQGEDQERVIPFLKTYVVFNAEQIDGLPERFYAKPAPEPVVEPNATEIVVPEAATRYFEAIPADVSHGGNLACFSPALDAIRLPPVEAFRSGLAYVSTRAHETVHWTGHKSRLDRDLKGRFGSDAYAAEELIAEIGAAFVCASIGTEPQIREDHAPYIASWLKVLKGDKRAILTAAARASDALDFLDGFQQQDEAEDIGRGVA